MNKNSRIFETERFSVALLTPFEARNLLSVLLQDEALAACVPWMTEKSQDGALRAAFGIDLQCAAGQIRVWGIVSRERRMQIGAGVARNTLEGIDVEVLVASRFWDDGVAEEAGDAVTNWLSNDADGILDLVEHDYGKIMSAASIALLH